ncbi:MAG: Lar family restriction alleviation protein [Anaerolineae bacterium]|nr:Lar family restriction alleviation protein [Anaerolineae bacterium]
MPNGITLRPCPFCGGANHYMDTMETDDCTTYHFVVCADCWAEGPMCAVFGPSVADPEELAQEAWNGDVL